MSAPPFAALDAAVSRLCRLQHECGSWSDFYLAPGASDGWVTAYTGTALALAARHHRIGAAARRRARAGSARASDWLESTVSVDGGWGWSSSVRPDADSTAWAVRLLALEGRPGVKSGLEFLAAHGHSGGYRTYRSSTAVGDWARPSPDVTAAVLLARFAGGELDQRDLAGEFHKLLAPAQGEDGCWYSHWWDGPAYPTAIAGAAWMAAGRPPLSRWPRLPTDRSATSFTVACHLWTASTITDSGGSPASAARLALSLMAGQRANGGWSGDAGLVVPPAHVGGLVDRSIDARGIFTTATALHALLAYQGLNYLSASRRRPLRSTPASRRIGVAGGSGPARRYAAVAQAMAVAAAVDTAAAVRVFASLTRESLRADVWPSRQLSTLAGGRPVEFSVGADPGLRLTADVGDPLLAPADRLASGLRAVRRTARLLHLDESLTATHAAVSVLADASLPVPDGCRFWLWAGADISAAKAPVLKAYLCAHADSVPGWQARERRFLDACGVPADGAVHAVLDRLKRDGWCHEAGVGLAPRGVWGIKVYYELHGYRPATVSDVLSLAGLDPDPVGLSPDVPGVLRASLAAKQRAGIAVRVSPDTGEVTEVTVAAAFPAPAVGRAAIADRVQDWLGDSGEPHAAAVAALLPGWEDAPAQERMHSLLTRSRSRSGDETKIYLRCRT